MRQNKPILHGGDHNCGGADPIPGYCILLRLPGVVAEIRKVVGGGDYVSIQTSRFGYHPEGSPFDQGVLTWPTITIPGAVVDEHEAAGYQMHARFSATVSRIDNIKVNPITPAVFPPAFTGTPPPTGDDQAVFVSGSGSAILTTVGGADVDVQMVVQSTTGSVVDHEAWVENGVLALTWIDGPDSIPAPDDGLLYPGGYPIGNNDISTDANIDPLKLLLPGGTTMFLRADGSFAAASFQVEY